MALSVNGNYTQQAIINPFQQRNEESRALPDKKPEENRTQPRAAAAADTQQAETRNERRAEQTAREERSEDRGSGRRGSTVDITV